MFYLVTGFILTPVWISMIIWPGFREVVSTNLDIATVAFFAAIFKAIGLLERKTQP